MPEDRTIRKRLHAIVDLLSSMRARMDEHGTVTRMEVTVAIDDTVYTLSWEAPEPAEDDGDAAEDSEA